MQQVMNEEHRASGTILPKLQVEKRAGVSAGTVNKYYERAIEQIPDRAAVEQNYHSFLHRACIFRKPGATAERLEDLLHLASAALLTAARSATSLAVAEAEIVRLVEEKNIKLAASQLTNSAALRLTTDATRVIQATGADASIAHQVAGVPSSTWGLRLRAVELEDQLRQVVPATASQRETEGLGLAEQDEPKNVAGRESDEPTSGSWSAYQSETLTLGSSSLTERTIQQAARLKLERAGQDPDQMIEGLYRPEGRQAKLLTYDAMHVIDGACVPMSAAYRIEADRIADVLSCLEEATRA
ncbi:hypothetical protein [Tianweitania sediminis]|uniref:Uncharacterized protein n=1 Tax=Tianweitania sediminis TaxID=1502156 RepID=A0A8J7UIN7_9HYPH|nr:hypothetical protein [Tianweitania sediminis]MBP0439113.1 hypothetical protein [Tianweitania sediminis]